MNQINNDKSEETNLQREVDERILGNIETPWMGAGVTFLSLIAVYSIPDRGSHANRDAPNMAESVGAFLGVCFMMTAFGSIVATPLWFIAKSLIEPRKLSFRPFLLIGMACTLIVVSLGSKLQAAQPNQAVPDNTPVSIEPAAAPNVDTNQTAPRNIENNSGISVPRSNPPTPQLSANAKIIADLSPLIIIGGVLWFFLRRYGKSPFEEFKRQMMFGETHKYDPCSMRVALRYDYHFSLDLWLNSDHYEFSLEDFWSGRLSDLDELMDTVISLKSGKGGASFTVLQEECSQDSWSIGHTLLSAKRLKVVITSYDNPDSDLFPTQVLKFYVDEDVFIDSFVAEFEKMAEQMDKPEYAECRGEFPWDKWRELTQLCGKTNE